MLTYGIITSVAIAQSALTSGLAARVLHKSLNPSLQLLIATRSTGHISMDRKIFAVNSPSIGNPVTQIGP
jgi:hypothetical protein